MSQDAQNPWFKRKLKGIITPSTEKKETPDGILTKKFPSTFNHEPILIKKKKII